MSVSIIHKKVFAQPIHVLLLNRTNGQITTNITIDIEPCRVNWLLYKGPNSVLKLLSANLYFYINLHPVMTMTLEEYLFAYKPFDSACHYVQTKVYSRVQEKN